MRYDYLINFLVYLCLFISCSLCQALDNWPAASNPLDVAMRAQRDVAKSVSITQLTNLGITSSGSIFEKEGYTTSALGTLLTALAVGIRTVYIDLYWNEFTREWQLCPAPFPSNASSNSLSVQEVTWKGRKHNCEGAMTVQSLMTTFVNYFESTNTNLEVNLMTMLLRLNSISVSDVSMSNTSASANIYKNPPIKNLGNSTLDECISPISKYLYKPTNMQESSTSGGVSTKTSVSDFYNRTSGDFPTLDTFMLQDYNRIIASVVENNLKESKNSYNISANDKKKIFLSSENFDSEIASSSNSSVLSSCQVLLEDTKSNNSDSFIDIAEETRFRYIIDNDQNSFTNETLRDFLRCGYSPILNASSYVTHGDKRTGTFSAIVNNFLPQSLWLWNPNDLTGENSVLLGYLSENSTDKHIAFRCVALSQDGGIIKNCYDKYHYACKNEEIPLNWKVDDKNQLAYLDATDEDACPKGYSLGTPSSSNELLSLMNYLHSENIDFPVWIDLNDITVNDCFVTGGPYATCPYQKTVSTGKLVGLIAPSFVVCVVILFLLVLEKFFRVNPIQTNRKRYWRKRINEYYKVHNYEGVPS
ncbi:Piso0_000674 [Millerozyma farinosa CBS 7064]|uniref:Maintenance of telomere capping protein 6 n=1 Tax=Pichia sorbitophila (strain ATCC MYA-4447 / BCRC 22081 / CBS 7064 / NBRC 10061 / NRRL Y-12695) TaxID=559304 RepID=G8YR74_PICSO|nr:Piso0_000674 [Millerozyma farinosa CBS 7064]